MVDQTPLLRLQANKAAVGLVLCHGFTGSMTEIRDCAEWLYQQGCSVSAILLPGHGTRPEDLAETRWYDWYARLEQAYLALKPNCSRVFLLGVSLGGMLSLRLASLHPELAGVVSMGTPLRLVDPLAKPWLIRLASHFMRYSPTTVDPEQTGFYYDRRPLRAILQLMDARDDCEKRLGSIYCPVLLLHARADGTAKFCSAEILMRRLASPHKYLYAPDMAEHVFLPPYTNAEYLKVWQLILNFVQNPTKNPVR